MREKPWMASVQTVAKAGAAKAERIRALLTTRSKIDAQSVDTAPPPDTKVPRDARAPPTAAAPPSKIDFSIPNQCANEDLRRFAELFDGALSDATAIHLALFWPQLPPAAILPWALRELGREPGVKPLRTLFINVGRAALRTLVDVEAVPSKLGALGVRRTGQVVGNAPVVRIPPDAHVYMFVGKPKSGGMATVPVSSILPHTVAIDDGVFWRNFDEKALKGFKRHYPGNRLDAIRQHLDALTSFRNSPAFALLLPAHFEGKSRRAALAKLKAIDLVVIDMTMAVVRGEFGPILQDILNDLEASLAMSQKRVLVLCDCPLRWSHLKRAIVTRRDAGPLGTRAQTHRLLWRRRGRGFERIGPLGNHRAPIVETIASAECAVSTRLWNHSLQAKDEELSAVLADGARALKVMALAASGAEQILKPYGDVHDAYHRIKRERHSFIPHYNAAQRLIAAGASYPKRDILLADLEEAHTLANGLGVETPLGRYLERRLATGQGDVLIVLRHPEDAHLARERLGEFLTEPGRFIRAVPELRVTTVARFPEEMMARMPTTVIWAASAIAGARAYIGNSPIPTEFGLLVAGQDTIVLSVAY